MTLSVEDIQRQIQEKLKGEYANVRLEFASQSFSNHHELWVYVLDKEQFENIATVCRKISESQNLDRLDPELWLIVRPWEGPWPGGETEEEIKKRRDDFIQRHKLKTSSSI